MKHWKITLDGYGSNNCDGGEVHTSDGEVIGTWSADENDHCSFTPRGESEPTIANDFLGLFCQEIAEWHEANEASRLANGPKLDAAG